MLYTTTDAQIMIKESIRFMKKYGAADGYKYVNAILDKMYKSNSENI